MKLEVTAEWEFEGWQPTERRVLELLGSQVRIHSSKSRAVMLTGKSLGQRH